MTERGYQAGEKFRCINFNFAGLRDTVPHLGLFNEREDHYDFSIPPEMKFAAHANALNEHRGGGANFNGRSIHTNAAAPEAANRIERGFLGAHSDIGGGYGTGDLSDVALMWMIEQASEHGVGVDLAQVREKVWAP